MLVLEYAVEHQKFLSAAMGVAGEATVRRIAHNGCRARHFVANPVEHAPVDTGDWGWDPWLVRAVHHCPLGKICVQFHRLFLSSSGDAGTVGDADAPGA